MPRVARAYATPLDQRRRNLLYGALRTVTVPLRSSRPSIVLLAAEGQRGTLQRARYPQWRMCHVIDLAQLDVFQRCRLIGAVAKDIGEPDVAWLYDEFRRFGGVPIDARGVLVSVPGDWSAL